MHSGTVLVVEDDASIRRLLGAVLGARGHTVVEAADGPSALPAARASDPDLVLLDVGLPGMDGFAVLELLKADAQLSDVPVLMVTAWAQPEAIARGLAAGAQDYVRKPFDVGDLGARVDAALRAASDRRRPAGGGARAATVPARAGGIDPITGLPGPEATAAELERRVTSAGRSRTPVTVLRLELDPSGPLDPGDTEVLRAVSRRLQARVPRGHLLGRADEQGFLVAVSSGLAVAQVLAEGLRCAVSERPFAAGGAIRRQTASVGLAEWDADEPVGALLDRCARAVGAASAAGGNAVRHDGAQASPARLAG